MRPAPPPCPVQFSEDPQSLYAQVLRYYTDRLRSQPEGKAYLEKRGIFCEAAIEKFQIGFADRTLGLALPLKAVKAGKRLRGVLQAAGILRASSGHEHFNGSVVVPIHDAQGKVQQIYGRKINDNLRKGTAYHLYLPDRPQGIWNRDALQSPEIILTEGIIDALTFWVHGFQHVTCIHHPSEGISDELLAALKSAGVKRVYFAYDHDDDGNRAVQRDYRILVQEGIDCYQVEFPRGHDANSAALQMASPTEELSELLAKAQWLANGNGSTPAVTRQEPNAPKTKPLPYVKRGTDYHFAFEDRQYRVRGLHKNPTVDRLQVSLKLAVEGLFFINRIDMVNFKSRQSFIREAARETDTPNKVIKKDMGRLFTELEIIQEERLANLNSPADRHIELTAEERAEALEFLRSPDLIKDLLADFATCGVVGEDTNKIGGWLAGVSRLLPKPLAVIVQSHSAAGKSTLMDAVLSFCSEEEQIKFSAMTGQSLYYLGGYNLKHKVLAIVEEEGAEKASYALKLLQSEGELKIASTGKDPDTGRIRTDDYRIEGPVAIFLTTTKVEIDEELLNRCIILTVDEGQAQTKRIHERQRLARTTKGILAAETRKAILRKQQNAQRLLKPYRVINDYAEQLTFVSSRTRNRRDNEKYLTLIEAVTLAHQFQRPLETMQVGEREFDYIRTTLQDIAIANELAAQVLARGMDELPPQTRNFLKQIQHMVKDRCVAARISPGAYTFRRREVECCLGMSASQTKTHLDRLVQMEYLRSHNLPQNVYEYQLLVEVDEAVDVKLPELTAVSALTHH